MIIKLKRPVFDYPDDYITNCLLGGTLTLGEETKNFYGYGISFRRKEDFNDPQLGNNLSAVRAIKDLFNDVENYLIRKSCEHTDTIQGISLSFDSAEVTEEGNIILKNRKEGK
jgi:hypothetical protein